MASQLNAPEPEPVSTDFVPLSDTRYGSLNDPNLPSMDAAQQRLQYRQNVGFYEKPPGPTTNTSRILAQAYGEGTPIYEEVMQGLQPTPTQPVSTETAMKLIMVCREVITKYLILKSLIFRRRPCRVSPRPRRWT